MEIEQREVKFRIEENPGDGLPFSGTYAIIENPGTKYELVRSPFNSIKEARQRELDIAEYWGFKAVELL